MYRSALRHSNGPDERLPGSALLDRASFEYLFEQVGPGGVWARATGPKGLKLGGFGLWMWLLLSIDEAATLLPAPAPLPQHVPAAPAPRAQASNRSGWALGASTRVSAPPCLTLAGGQDLVLAGTHIPL